LLSAHYRQPLEWSQALIAQSKATLDRWYRFLSDLERDGSEETTVDSDVIAALSDDVNTPQALSVIANKLGQRRRAGALALTSDLYWPTVQAARLMGFLRHSPEEWFRGEGDSRIDLLIAERSEAKKNRDFAMADRIRDELAAEGVLLEDGPQGTTWRRA
jgi:cysteinyl-tRNA synthetase